MNKKELLKLVKEIQPKLGGWTTERKALLIAEAIYDNNLKYGLEIGVYLGGSAIPAGFSLQNNGGNLIAVDPWQKQASVIGQNEANANWWQQLDHEEIYKTYIAEVEKYNLSNTICTLRITNKEYASVKDTGVLDYLNIDGNHSPEESVFDIETFVPRVKSGGYIWQDDIVWDGRSDAYEKILTMGVEEVARESTGVLFRKS